MLHVHVLPRTAPGLWRAHCPAEDSRVRMLCSRMCPQVALPAHRSSRVWRPRGVAAGATGAPHAGLIYQGVAGHPGQGAPRLGGLPAPHAAACHASAVLRSRLAHTHGRHAWPHHHAESPGGLCLPQGARATLHPHKCMQDHSRRLLLLDRNTFSTVSCYCRQLPRESNGSVCHTRPGGSRSSAHLQWHLPFWMVCRNSSSSKPHACRSR